VIPNIGSNVYKDAPCLEIFFYNQQFFLFVKFATEVMGLNQIAAVSDKKSKRFPIFVRTN